jgi:ATP-dependent RNA helicase DDX52/ROK1
MSKVFAALTRGVKFKPGAKKGVVVSGGAQAYTAQPVLNLFDLVSASGEKRQRDVEEEDDGGEAEEEEEEEDEEGTQVSSKSRKFRNDEAVNEFRNMMQIKAKGSKIPAPVTTFYDMPISEEIKATIIKNIEESDWKEPTAIQMQAIPALLAGRDVLAAAPTGSGKTAAYLIPVLSALKSAQKRGIRAIILAPTRELAEQIHREANRLCVGRRIRCGLLKKSNAAQAMAQSDGSVLGVYDVLISTPMRLLYLCRQKGGVDLSAVKMVVLDEADRLFELSSGGGGGGDQHEEEEENEEEEDSNTRSSFLSQVDEILSKCPSSGVQRALFSATLGPFVLELAGGVLRDAVHITIGKENTGASSIDQQLTFCGSEEGKLLAMRQLIQKGLRPPVLLFVQSVDRAKSLFRELVFDGINVEAIHAEKTQKQREEIIRQFRVGEIWVLICTDLMARGVDFKGVQMVINYDLPQTAVSYIHRIGRTGRAGRRGTAVTFFTEDDLPKLRSIANVMRQSGCEVPEWMLSIKQLTTKQKRVLRQAPPKRNDIIRTAPTDFDLKSKRRKKKGRKD